MTSALAAVNSLPYPFADKGGRTLQVRALDECQCQALLDMYLAFEPRNCFQGLPPIRDEVCAQWVRDMIRDGLNLVAWGAQEMPIVLGHAALFPINARKCEMLVVVSSTFQNQGAGTALVQASLRAARELGFEQMWLPVAATNVRARHVYEKCGFEYVSKGLSRELEMSCRLNSH